MPIAGRMSKPSARFTGESDASAPPSRRCGCSTRPSATAVSISMKDSPAARSRSTRPRTVWLDEHGCPVDDVQKATISGALARKDLPPTVRRVLELRRDGAHAATAKYSAMLNWRAEDGRAHGCFVYHGASTGRWASYGIQVQNLKKVPPGGLAEEAIASVRGADFDRLRELRPEDPLGLVGEVARAALIASPGHRLVIADFSGIESRVLAWLAGERWKTAQWAKFDGTGRPEDEPYYINGIAFGFAPENARAPGKTGDLAFGYMGGIGAYRKFAPDDPADDAAIKGRRPLAPPGYCQALG
jgi:DNA polymerase bacteriophage-type